ncbi:type II secretion system minor pseudopilin GspJ [Thioflexithrix psekupsensis]|uniref:type II secretion system minor pseudopilin GspJ n=1 Tax=Thioflexithrix psekupsensis TaxID=1570016 RepID=UPI001FD9745B|nr:type II secretion system minor pseudopilin GspJ [Thioflexithrix psekupsensis]
MEKGFTLLELLIALSIFALIAVMAYGGLGTVLELSAHTQEQAQYWKKIQFTLARLQQDVEYFTPRSIRNPYGDVEPALSAQGDSVVWTRDGWLNPLQQTRSALQRVRYRYENGGLWRDQWVVLDQAQDSQPYSILMLDNVEQIKWQFLDQDHVWHDVWPPTAPSWRENSSHLDNETENKTVISSPYLRAIAVTLTLPRFGELTRLMAVVAGE